MKRWTIAILESTTKVDFVNFCRSKWYKKKDIIDIMDLLIEFIQDSLINKWKFIYKWLFTIYRAKTTTNLHEWIFTKVKVELSDTIKYLFRKK